MSDLVDEVEGALHFDECNRTFCSVKSQSASGLINRKKIKENE